MVIKVSIIILMVSAVEVSSGGAIDSIAHTSTVPSPSFTLVVSGRDTVATAVCIDGNDGND